ncbi:MAG: damage repair protein [bacterium]|nr:damage repair protein [bacterium]
MCIDLKSFYASCECVERNINPFTTPLVVANPNQGKGAITLAITPYLKNKGIKSRTRLYEIPPWIKYEIVKPRMSLYVAKSKEIISIYLDFVSEEDLHVYSIDECFLDVTHYLKMYNKTDVALAKEILKTITKKTGLTANCGIGPNMLLAKIAMDTEAKKYKDGIAKWTYDDVKTKLWPITPLSKMWSIGKRLEVRLNALGLYKVGDIANFKKEELIKRFGILGEELFEHANGIDNSTISDFKMPPKNSSYSASQVLFKDYNGNNIKIIISETIEVICRRLRKNNKQASIIGLGIGYSIDVGGGFYHSMKVNPTIDEGEFFQVCSNIFDKYYDDNPIRKVSVVAGALVDASSIQLNLFSNVKTMEDNKKLNDTVDAIKEKYGKNSIIKASNLLSDSTAIERNGKIGGHSA